MSARDGAFELVTLRNGARAVRHLGHGEVMHPSVGPWVEAQRLYVEQSGLEALLCRPGPPLVIHDVGLGAGTNAVAAIHCAVALGDARTRELHIHSFEMDLAPMRLALGDPEGFPFLQPHAEIACMLMQDGMAEANGIQWSLHLGDALSFYDDGLPAADLVFFDPFSPQANPGMWTVEALERVRSRCRSDGGGARLFTYSAATPTRVTLLLAGFFVGAGWSTGLKGETTEAATRLESLRAPLGSRWLARWERSSSRAPHGMALDDTVERRVRGHAQFAVASG